MELVLVVDDPMGFVVVALAPVFFEFAFAVEEMLFVGVFVDEVVGVEEALSTHGWDKDKLSDEMASNIGSRHMHIFIKLTVVESI
jgi:hypothetical protein